MQSERSDPFLHVLFTIGSEDKIFLNKHSLAEQNFETKWFVDFLWLALHYAIIVQWLKVLRLEVLLFPHLVYFEVDKSCIGQYYESLLPLANYFSTFFPKSTNFANESKVISQNFVCKNGI